LWKKTTTTLLCTGVQTGVRERKSSVFQSDYLCVFAHSEGNLRKGAEVLF